MEKYTQYAIEPENRLIQKYYNCTISKDGKFNIEINLTKFKNIKLAINNNNLFF